MDGPLRVIGYHGTSVRAARSILRRGFRLSRNEYDWLGDGVYFFQDAPARARDWATVGFGSDAAVIRSVIRLEDCMDLLDIEWFEVLSAAYTSLLAAAEEARQPLPRQTRGAHRIDRQLINYAVETLEQGGFTIRAVRAAFTEGRPLYPGSALFDRAHVQIAVRDLSIIEDSRIVE